MDILEEYLTTCLHYYNQLVPYISTRHNYLQTLLSLPSQTATSLNRLLSSDPNSPTFSLQNIALLLVIFFLSLRLLNMLRRFVISWVLFVIQLVIWAFVALLAVWIYLRGFEETVEDVKTWGGDIGRVWVREKGKWEEVARLAGENRVRGGDGTRWR